MKNVISILVKELRNAADRLETGECAIGIDAAEDILGMIVHIPMSKVQAYEFLNVSRATFDNMVAIGEIPKGRKEKGKKELVWYKDELQKCVKRLRH